MRWGVNEMASEKRIVAEKTLLGSAVIPLYVFAIQNALRGDYYVGGAAIVIATVLFAGYHYLDLRRLPIDRKKLEQLAEDLGDSARKAVDSEDPGALPDGVERDGETGQFQSSESSDSS